MRAALAGALALGLALASACAHAAGAGGAGGAAAWWVWPLGLFVTCFLIGIVAVPAGIGGGTLFVPIVGSFFPFHLDVVRGAGLLGRWRARWPPAPASCAAAWAACA